jgi:hypothetical protein
MPGVPESPCSAAHRPLRTAPQTAAEDFASDEGYPQWSLKNQRRDHLRVGHLADTSRSRRATPGISIPFSGSARPQRPVPSWLIGSSVPRRPSPLHFTRHPASHVAPSRFRRRSLPVAKLRVALRLRSSRRAPAHHSVAVGEEHR